MQVPETIKLQGGALSLDFANSADWTEAIDAGLREGIFNVRGINEVTQNYFRHFAGATVPLARLTETPLGSVWPQALLQPGSHHRLAISVWARSTEAPGSGRRACF